MHCLNRTNDPNPDKRLNTFTLNVKHNTIQIYKKLYDITYITRYLQHEIDQHIQ